MFNNISGVDRVDSMFFLVVQIQVQIQFSAKMALMLHQEASSVCPVQRELSVQHQDLQNMFLVLMALTYTQMLTIRAAARAVQLVRGVQTQTRHQRTVLMAHTVRVGQWLVLCVPEAISE